MRFFKLLAKMRFSKLLAKIWNFCFGVTIKIKCSYLPLLTGIGIAVFFHLLWSLQQNCVSYVLIFLYLCKMIFQDGLQYLYGQLLKRLEEARFWNLLTIDALNVGIRVKIAMDAASFTFHYQDCLSSFLPFGQNITLS